MSRNEPFYLAPDMGNIAAPLYVEYLAQDGVISEDKFSFYFTQPGSLSWVDLGKPVDGHIKAGTEIRNIQMLENDFFWAHFCQGMAFGDTSDENSYYWGELQGFKTW